MDYSYIKDEIAKLNSAAKIVMKEAFVKGPKKLFEAHPILEKFSFVAYTRYFCDGDPTYYMAEVDYPDINEIKGYDIGDATDPKYLEGVSEDQFTLLKAAHNDIRDFLSQFDSSHYEMIFGDHTRITIYRDGRLEQKDFTEHD